MKSKEYLGYYAHHHGSGHITKAMRIIEHIEAPVKLFSSAEPSEKLNDKNSHVKLPLDIDTASQTGSTPSFLHFSANKSSAIHDRMHILAKELHDVRVLLVDVSVEITLLARLLSIPTIVMRMHGQRTDTPHLLAYESAEQLIAPFPAILEQENTPQWIQDKTTYIGGFSKFQQRDPLSIYKAREILGTHKKKIVTVITSLGGNGVQLSDIVAMARESPKWDWLIAGKTSSYDKELPPNLHLYGVVDDTWPYLCAANVIMGSAGQNTIMEIATANKPAVIIPESRPFREQEEKAKSLKNHGLATVFSTTQALLEADVASVLEATSAMEANWSSILSPTSAKDFAATLDTAYKRLVW